MFTIFLSKIYFSSLLNSWENKLLEFSCFLENMTCLEKSKVHVYKILKTCHSVLKGISPILKYWPPPFFPTPPPPQKKNNWRTWPRPLTPWNISSSKKAKTHVLKKQKILFPTMDTFQHWNLKNMNILLQNLKSKEDLLTD